MSAQKKWGGNSAPRAVPRRAARDGAGISTSSHFITGTSRPIEISELPRLLAHIAPVDRDIWLRVGMAIKAEFGEAGFSIWDEWSQRAANYKRRDALAVWRSIGPGEVTFGTVIHLAKQGGWRPDPNAPRPSKEEFDERARRAEAARRKAEAQRAKRHRRAAAEARRLWEAATPETGGHRYLRDKNIEPHGIFTDGFRLLIPMRDIEGKLWNLQRIDPRGDKRFLRGGRVTGLFHRIGRPVDQTLVICEGYATGATLHESSGQAVAVAFNCNNLKPVAKALRSKYPEATLIIAADNDRHTLGNPGLTKANEAALAVGGRVAVPEFDDGEPGTDWNDWHNNRQEALT